MGRGLGWFVKAAISVVVLIVLAVVVVRIVGERAQPDEPGEFYQAPDPLESEEPGAVIRSEEIEGYTDKGTAHRVL